MQKDMSSWQKDYWEGSEDNMAARKARDNRQAVTVRFNLLNEKERKIYECLTDKEHGDISMAAQVRDILYEHYENEKKEKQRTEAFQKMQIYYKKTLVEIKNMVKEELQNHDMRVLAVLASNGNYTSINLADMQKKGKGMELPKESKELPEGMDSVLKMFQ